MLAGLAPGTELVLKGPSFTLPHDHAVLITGGIGVTPVRSMLLQARHERRAPPLVVLYTNRRPARTAVQWRGKLSRVSWATCFNSSGVAPLVAWMAMPCSTVPR